jgi:hypothetical protein
MIPTTVTADMAVGCLLTAGVSPGPVAVGRELVPPHAAKNNARSSRRYKQHVYDKRFISAKQGEDKGG